MLRLEGSKSVFFQVLIVAMLAWFSTGARAANHRQSIQSQSGYARRVVAEQWHGVSRTGKGFSTIRLRYYDLGWEPLTRLVLSFEGRAGILDMSLNGNDVTLIAGYFQGNLSLDNEHLATRNDRSLFLLTVDPDGVPTSFRILTGLGSASLTIAMRDDGYFNVQAARPLFHDTGPLEIILLEVDEGGGIPIIEVMALEEEEDPGNGDDPNGLSSAGPAVFLPEANDRARITLMALEEEEDPGNGDDPNGLSSTGSAVFLPEANDRARITLMALEEEEDPGNGDDPNGLSARGLIIIYEEGLDDDHHHEFSMMSISRPTLSFTNENLDGANRGGPNDRNLGLTSIQPLEEEEDPGNGDDPNG